MEFVRLVTIRENRSPSLSFKERQFINASYGVGRWCGPWGHIHAKFRKVIYLQKLQRTQADMTQKHRSPSFMTENTFKFLWACTQVAINNRIHW